MIKIHKNIFIFTYNKNLNFFLNYTEFINYIFINYLKQNKIYISNCYVFPRKKS